MTIIDYKKGECNGGILAFGNGKFEAFTAAQTRNFKTLKGADKWLASFGYKQV